MYKQTTSIIHTSYLCLFLLAAKPLELFSSYSQELLPLLAHNNQKAPITVHHDKSKSLTTVLPAELWYSIIEYLEGNNIFLNSILARILIPTARVRHTIITSFNNYLARVSPEQRIKALKLFYNTVFYVHEQNILGKTAHVTQALTKAVMHHNFREACTHVPKLIDLPQEHVNYLSSHYLEHTTNYAAQESLNTSFMPCLCSMLGIILIFLGIVAFTQTKPFNNNYAVSTTLVSALAFYSCCYGLMFYYRLRHLRTLKKFITILQEYTEPSAQV